MNFIQQIEDNKKKKSASNEKNFRAISPSFLWIDQFWRATTTCVVD